MNYAVAKLNCTRIENTLENWMYDIEYKFKKPSQNANEKRCKRFEESKE